MNQEIHIEMLVHQYLTLQGKFDAFCASAKETLPAGNPLGTIIGERNGLTWSMQMLGHQCRLRFATRNEGHQMLGEVVFERELGRDLNAPFWVLEFDNLGNARAAGEVHWMSTLATHDVRKQHMPRAVRTMLGCISSAAHTTV